MHIVNLKIQFYSLEMYIVNYIVIVCMHVTI